MTMKKLKAIEEAFASGGFAGMWAAISRLRAMPSVTMGSGPDVLVLAIAKGPDGVADQFTISVDGKQIGGRQTALAGQAAGVPEIFDVRGQFGAGPHSLTVDFLVGRHPAMPTGSRTLYVDHVTYDGVAVTATPLSVLTPGAHSMAFSAGAPVPPNSIGHVQLLGVSLSGGEYGNPASGRLNYDYTYPTHGEIDYYASAGLNVVRIPILWERLQPVQGGPLNPAQLSILDDLVSYAASKGMRVDIDPHNYGYGYGNMIGSAGTPNASFADFWGKMAAHYASAPNVVFGLMNEPHDQNAAQWAGSAQAAVNAIRAAGATQEILASGTDFDGGSSWITSGNAINVGKITDPGHNLVFEVHQYFDANQSGTSTQIVSPTVGPDRLAAVTQWAEATGNKLFLGEFGAGSDPASLQALGNTLTFLNAHSDVWQGGAYWAGGPWLGSYMFSAEPQNGVEAAQTKLLSAAMHG